MHFILLQLLFGLDESHSFFSVLFSGKFFQHLGGLIKPVKV